MANCSRQKFAEYNNIEIIVADFEKYTCPDCTYDLVYAKYMPSTAPKPDYTENECKRVAEIALKYGFEDISYKIYHRRRKFDADSFVSLQRTHGGHADYGAIQHHAHNNFQLA